MHEVDTVEVIVDGYALEASLSLLTYQEAREFCRTRGGHLAHYVVKSMDHRRYYMIGRGYWQLRLATNKRLLAAT